MKFQIKFYCGERTFLGNASPEVLLRLCEDVPGFLLGDVLIGHVIDEPTKCINFSQFVPCVRRQESPGPGEGYGFLLENR